MTITVSTQEFCARVAELVKLVEGGDEVTIEEPGKPQLRLIAGPPQEGVKSRGAWVFDMHPGGYIAPDFADPLPDDFWEHNK